MEGFTESDFEEIMTALGKAMAKNPPTVTKAEPLNNGKVRLHLTGSAWGTMDVDQGEWNKRIGLAPAVKKTFTYRSGR